MVLFDHRRRVRIRGEQCGRHPSPRFQTLNDPRHQKPDLLRAQIYDAEMRYVRSRLRVRFGNHGCVDRGRPTPLRRLQYRRRMPARRLARINLSTFALCLNPSDGNLSRNGHITKILERPGLEGFREFARAGRISSPPTIFARYRARRTAIDASVLSAQADEVGSLGLFMTSRSGHRLLRALNDHLSHAERGRRQRQSRLGSQHSGNRRSI